MLKYLDSTFVIQPATVQRDEYLFLVEYVKERHIKTVLEFGPGISTWAFLENDCEITSLEYNDLFYDCAFETFKEFDKVEIVRYNDEPVITLLLSGEFDVAFVDSPVGVKKNFARLNTCMFASQRTKRILLHDSRRVGEQLTQMVFTELGWNVIEVCSSQRGIAEMAL